MNAEFEFSEKSNKHFNSLAKYCKISAAALLLYAISNASYFIVAVNSGKVNNLMLRSADDILVIVAALYAAFELIQAGKCYRKIVKTEGNDIQLLNVSNARLRSVFAGLSIMLILLVIRFLLNYQSFIDALNC